MAGSWSVIEALRLGAHVRRPGHPVCVLPPGASDAGALCGWMLRIEQYRLRVRNGLGLPVVDAVIRVQFYHDGSSNHVPGKFLSGLTVTVCVPLDVGASCQVTEELKCLGNVRRVGASKRVWSIKNPFRGWMEPSLDITHVRGQ